MAQTLSDLHRSLLFPTWPNLGEKTAVYDKQPWEWEVSEEEIKRMRLLPKSKRKEVMADGRSRWNIYSVIRGENWFHPVSGENPPAVVLALAADYDVPIDQQYIQQACEQRFKLKGWCPTHIETSLSGHCRCLWLFEMPVMVQGKKFCDEFLKRLGEFVDAGSFLPGIDRKSYGSEMRWTNGGYWSLVDYGKIVPADVLTGIAIKVSSSLSAKKIELPLDRLADLLSAKYPKFEKFDGGKLELGRAGIRFWDENADNPNGALVVDRGFYCVTGETALVTWEDLLGKTQVENLRMSNYGAAADGIYFDSRRYFVRAQGAYHDYDRVDILLRIASHGFDRSKKKDEVMSPAEHVLLYIQNEHKVDGAAPFLYHEEGVIRYQGNHILNLSRARPMQPSDKLDSSPDDFPRLWEFFNKFFARPENRPLDYFLTWFKRFYTGAVNKRPLNGQAVFICGPAGCGKNFLSELILPTAMGGAAPNPYRFLMGDTDFSDDILSAPILAINDEDAPAEHKKSIFEQKVKAIVANNDHAYHPKFMKKVRISWNGRLVCTLNDGPKDVGLLPMLNPNTAGKMHFFLAWQHDFKFADKHTNREMVERELPFFLRWIFSTYEVPEDILIPNDRFGMKSYHDPFLVRVNRQEQMSYNLLELLAAWMSHDKWNDNKPEWSGTPTDLLRAFSLDQSLENLLKDWSPSQLAKGLGDLARAQTPGVMFDPENKGRRYIIIKKAVQATVSGKSTAAEKHPDVQTEFAA